METSYIDYTQRLSRVRVYISLCIEHGKEFVDKLLSSIKCDKYSLLIYSVSSFIEICDEHDVLGDLDFYDWMNGKILFPGIEGGWIA